MATLEQHLSRYFHYDSFREGQKEIISDILSGQDVLGILPTGTGKSICYQLPALIQEGATIVVSPLISLMVDQVKQLKQKGIKRVVAINSFLDSNQKQKVLQHLHEYTLIYCSPEMLQNDRFMEALRKRINVSLFVVDEAHCISQWGHEFRTDYLKLGEAAKKLGNPTMLALSATAPLAIQDDILTQLERPQMAKHIYPMDRENIALAVSHVNSMEEKIERMKTILKERPVPTMIYFSSRQWTEKATFELRDALPHLRVAFYHGGMEHTDRLLIQQQFMNDQLDVICCTSAFGMGVNKDNIRLVIHAHLPPQVESFLQEIGRAGRDGKQSVSLTFYSPGDGDLPRSLISSELPEPHQLSQLRHYLVNLKQSHQPIPSSAEVEATLQLSEIQWRFLNYQLEQKDVIHGGFVRSEEPQLDSALHEIMQTIEHRALYKHEKLSEFIRWVHGDTCRRVTLYESFQSSLKEPLEFCCDICDFSFDKWHPDILQGNHEVPQWEEALKRVFLQGDRL
ncbi:ATP-dependent DNA helicase [Pontibacillus halophilus JSM 076056 = DSM 19796]|uniref:ATP-dependent DNA helicase n=1 Tax=Pontibacillus halophilus JSM 076056 = DSM 19796 TaxID=1385510 RepID=A0A0A5GJM1_9BACI|nr:ATP-dependent DNA helicase RecQ [Pontibacillus halophilus]KGX92194.1 ATP-dependent DNA helicase [Pontibacillus halophilus JSM 076056 = DSM 19796]